MYGIKNADSQTVRIFVFTVCLQSYENEHKFLFKWQKM